MTVSHEKKSEGIWAGTNSHPFSVGSGDTSLVNVPGQARVPLLACWCLGVPTHARERICAVGVDDVVGECTPTFRSVGYAAADAAADRARHARWLRRFAEARVQAKEATC